MSTERAQMNLEARAMSLRCMGLLFSEIATSLGCSVEVAHKLVRGGIRRLLRTAVDDT